MLTKTGDFVPTVEDNQSKLPADIAPRNDTAHEAFHCS